MIEGWAERMFSCLCCANFCSIFALTGIVFLLIIGILLQKQPIYIKGALHPEVGATVCYQGAAIYFAIWAVSIITLMIDRARKNNPLSKREPEEPMIQKSYGSKTYGALAQNDTAAGKR